MEFKQIFKVFSRYTELSDFEKEYIKNNSQFITYNKRDTLHENNLDCKNIWFINKGFGRYYVNNPDGSQTTANFFGENDFVTDYDSFFNKKKTFGIIEALTDIEAIIIPETLLFWMLLNIKNFHKIKDEILNYYFSNCSQRIVVLLEKDPLIAYGELVMRYPNIEQVVSQKLIASFLNISPVHLSRIKSQKQNF